MPSRCGRHRIAEAAIDGVILHDSFITLIGGGAQIGR
jgi:hypothetical protein